MTSPSRIWPTAKTTVWCPGVKSCGCSCGQRGDLAEQAAERDVPRRTARAAVSRTSSSGPCPAARAGRRCAPGPAAPRRPGSGGRSRRPRPRSPGRPARTGSGRCRWSSPARSPGPARAPGPRRPWRPASRSRSTWLSVTVTGVELRRQRPGRAARCPGWRRPRRSSTLAGTGSSGSAAGRQRDAAVAAKAGGDRGSCRGALARRCRRQRGQQDARRAWRRSARPRRSARGGPPIAAQPCVGAVRPGSSRACPRGSRPRASGPGTPRRPPTSRPPRRGQPAQVEQQPLGDGEHREDDAPRRCASATQAYQATLTTQDEQREEEGERRRRARPRTRPRSERPDSATTSSAGLTTASGQTPAGANAAASSRPPASAGRAAPRAAAAAAAASAARRLGRRPRRRWCPCRPALRRPVQ